MNVYLVGGAVRDALLNLPVKERDWLVVGSTVEEMTDAGAPVETCNNIKHIAKNTPGVRSVHKCRTRRLGSGLEVDLHILVDPGITVKDGHAIAGAVKHNIIDSVEDVVDVIVHTEPYN